MSAPTTPTSPTRPLKEASEHWLQLSSRAAAQQTLERRKYDGETYTTSAALLDKYPDSPRSSASLPASPRALPVTPGNRSSSGSGRGYFFNADDSNWARQRKSANANTFSDPGFSKLIKQQTIQLMPLKTPPGVCDFNSNSPDDPNSLGGAVSNGDNAIDGAVVPQCSVGDEKQEGESTPEAGAGVRGEDESDRADKEQLIIHIEQDENHEGAISTTHRHNFCSRGVVVFREKLSHFCTIYSAQISTFWSTLFFLLFSAYFAWIIAHDPEKGSVVIGITAFWLFMKIYGFIRDFHSDRVMKAVCLPFLNKWNNRPRFVNWVLIVLLLVGLGLFLGLDIGRNPIQLRSIIGTCAILTFSYLNSTNPAAVRWRPVIWGIGLQITMGIIVLRWRPGYEVFFWISKKVQVLLNYADYGAKFIFGDPAYMDHPIAFKVIPMVVFFSAITNMLFYIGAMQVVISKMSWLMQHTMHTTTIESLSVAGNIFFTLTEEAFILRPYMSVLTMSELHAVMVGGSATVAGFALAMYIELGAPPIHVFSAAVMSAPAALAIAKLSYPETQESKTKTESDVHLESGTEANVLEAAAAGATMSIKVISYAIVIIIAFYGLLALINDLLSYAGDLVGHPELSFTLICSYIFFPLAWMLGVPVADCRNVASIMGMKFFGSDLIAYGQLGELQKQGFIQDRSIMITTYAVLGFSSLSSVGVSIGILGALCPARRKDVSDLALRAILNGNLASMLTACLAGLLNHS